MVNPVEPRTLAGRLAQSPGWAMARQGAQNINALRQGTPMGISPAQAYQQSIARQAAMRQQEQEEKRRMQLLNPFYEYEMAVDRGYANLPDGSTMSFPQWQQASFRRGGPTSVMQNFDRWRQLNPQRADETDEAYQQRQAEAFNTLARAPQMVDVGGGGVQSYQPLTGTGTTVVSPDAATQREGDLSYVRQQEEAQASQDAEFRTAAASLPELESQLQDTIALREAIRNKEFQDTGYFEGRVMRFTDEKTAELAAKQVLQTLRNLQITNLAPVTEAEIRLIEDLYASVLKDPEANIGALNAAIEMMESKINTINQMGRYFVRDNTLRDYGIQQRWSEPEDPEVEIPGLE